MVLGQRIVKVPVWSNSWWQTVSKVSIFKSL